MKTKMIKTLCALLLSLAMLLCAVPAFAADGNDVDTSGATAFTFSDSGIAVTAEGSGKYKIDGTALTIQARPVATAAPSMPQPKPATKSQSSRMLTAALARVTASPMPGRSAAISRG